MGSLSNCLREAGELITPEIRAQITSRASALRREGLAGVDAGKRAIAEAMDTSATSLKDAETGLRDSGAAPPAAPVKVRLPGEEASLSLPEALERIKTEQKADAQMAELVRVAAACALTGAAAT